MHAGPRGEGKLVEVLDEFARDELDERQEISSKLCRIRVVPGLQLGVELQQPGVAIRLLKVLCLFEELEFSRDVLLVEVLGQLLAYERSERQVGEVFAEGDHHPH